MNKLLHRLCPIILLLASVRISKADSTAPPSDPSSALASVSQFHPQETVAERDARMKWWREAKFGLFIHFGLYAVPSGGEWYMRMHKMSIADYAKFAAQFNPTEFNADEWARIAHDAGMKYMVFTSKHHDGFANFKTEASPFNIFDASPFKRDLVKELAEACPKHDVRFGVYYSAATDWHHPGGGVGCPRWDPAQNGDNLTYVKTVAVPQVHELLTNYGPLSEFWFDNDGSSIVPEGAALLAKEMDLQPQLIIDNRLTGFRGDFGSAERHIPALALPGDWEGCSTTISGSWGYAKRPARPFGELLHELIDVVSKGGNYLLNVGPMPNGVFPPDNVDRLMKIGAWLKINGEAIYGTTRSPFDFLSWGRCTRKGNMLYLHVFDWPKDGVLNLPMANRVLSAHLLADPGARVNYETRNGKCVLHLPVIAPDPIASVIALQIEGDIPRVRSLTFEKPAEAFPADEKHTAQGVMNQKGQWQIPKGVSPAWLQVDLGSPQPVSFLRIDCNKGMLKKFTLEYEDGGVWKTLCSGSNMTRDVYVQSFPPVTAQVFRLNVLEVDDEIDLVSFELFPPE